MSHIPGPTSRLKQPSSIKSKDNSRPSSRAGSKNDDGPERPTLSRENSASRLPVFRRESSMPQIKRETAVPSMRREKSELDKKAPVLKTPGKTPAKKTSTTATPRTAIITPQTITSPKTVELRKVSEKNIAAKGTRSGVSGFSDIIMIGDRVLITGTEKRGVVQFVGETKFAKGTSAGIVLDEPTGKNDGSVGGVRYFSCPKLRGVFVKEEKLKKIGDPRDPGFLPHSGGTDITSKPSTEKNNMSRNDSSLSTDSGVDEGHDLSPGDKVMISSASGVREGILRYVGQTGFAKGVWCGVELSEPNGKNDGAVAGTRYFQCESKHGIFAQLHKVKKLNSSSESETPLTPTSHKPSLSTPRKLEEPTKEHVVTEKTEAISDADSTTKAVEVAILHDDIVNRTSSNQNDVNKFAEYEKVQEEHLKKIASLELQLYKRDEEIQKLLEGESKQQRESFDISIREHQENSLKYQSKANQLERDKLNLQNTINEQNHKIEDLQFQLEEQLLLAGEEDKGRSKEDLEKLLCVEEQLKSKDTEITSLTQKLSKLSDANSKEIERMNDKEIQLAHKDDEIKKFRELLDVGKQNELMLTNEVNSLKSQLQELRDLKSSVSDTEQKYASERSEFENKLYERDQKVSNMQDEMEEMKNDIKKLRHELNAKESINLDLHQQVTKARDELNDTVEAKGALNKQIVDLNTELNSKREELQSNSAVIESLRKEKLDVTANLEVANSRNDQFIDDKRKLEEEILKVSKNSGDNAQQLVYLNEQIQAKNREITELQDKVNVLNADNKKQTQEIDEIKDKHVKEKLNIEKEKGEEIKNLKSSITLLEDHFQKLKIRNEETEQAIKKETIELQQSSNEVFNLNESLKQKDDQLGSKEKEINELMSKLSLVSQTSDKYKCDLESSQNTLTLKNNELEKLQLEINQFKNNSNIYEEKYDELLVKYKDTETDRERFQKKISCLENELNIKEKEKETLSKSFEEVLTKAEKNAIEKKELEKLKLELIQDKEKLEKLNEDLNKKLSETQSSSLEYQQKIATIERQMNDGSSTVEFLQNELEATRSDLKSANDKNKELEKENASVLKKQLEIVEEKDFLLEEIKMKKETEEESQRQSQVLREQLQQALDREKTVRSTLEKDRAELQAKVEASNNSKKTLEENIVLLTSKVTELEIKNQDLGKNQAPEYIETQESESVSSQIHQTVVEELQKSKNAENEKKTEVEFLNSIIVDLQKKNKEQEEKIKILCYGEDDTLMKDNMNDTMSPIKPGLRVRLFCDICDVFDQHDTEDCPLQSNEENGTQHHGERGVERPYCTVCEVFGHTAETCDDEEMF